MGGNFRSDELHFTGADLGRLSRRKDYAYSSDSDGSSESNSGSENVGTGSNTQLVLRDKEDTLVEKALARIRRAQELGKNNVKLSQAELDALQRKRKKDAERQAQKDKERARSGKTSKKSSKKEKPNERRISIPIAEYEDSSRSNLSPGMLVTTSSGRQKFAPIGYPTPVPTASSKSSRSGSRNPSLQNLTRRSPEQTRRPERRGSKPPSPHSPSSSTRSLPDDPNWMPRPRSSSVLSGPQHYGHPNYPYHYQGHSPPLPQMPAQYDANSRRIVSNPQPSTRDRLPRYEGLSAHPEASRSRRRATPSESDSDSDDDSDQGVSVDIVSAHDGRGYDIRQVSEGTSRDRRKR